MIVFIVGQFVNVFVLIDVFKVEVVYIGVVWYFSVVDFYDIQFVGYFFLDGFVVVYCVVELID